MGDYIATIGNCEKCGEKTTIVNKICDACHCYLKWEQKTEQLEMLEDMNAFDFDSGFYK